MRILHVVGARPNFIKLAPVFDALAQAPGISQMLVHTGQHYDPALSEVFFQQLKLPQPDINLGVGSGSRDFQIAEVVKRVTGVLEDVRPERVVVYGDVNSTLAAAQASAKMGIPVAHVEAGLRSFDPTMPEEINRRMTDQISEFLFTPSADANENLEREGMDKSKIFLVGNVMIDTLVRMRPHIEDRARAIHGDFILVTLHRPSNVDDLPWLRGMIEMLATLSSGMEIRFPVHPRTRERIQHLSSDFTPDFTGDFTGFGRLRLMEPLPYVDFLALQSKARLVITDSGGVQEETTFLGTPCLTVRENTERPITVTIGTNLLTGRNLAAVRREADKILGGGVKPGVIPPLWDGKAATRIAQVLARP